MDYELIRRQVQDSALFRHPAFAVDDTEVDQKLHKQDALTAASAA